MKIKLVIINQTYQKNTPSEIQTRDLVSTGLLLYQLCYAISFNMKKGNLKHMKGEHVFAI